MDYEVTVEQDRPEAVAAPSRQAAMVEELRKVELVRDRLEGLQQLVALSQKATIRARSWRSCTSTGRSGVEVNIGALQDALLHPCGTREALSVSRRPLLRR
jgi:hypothetical protein